MKRFATMALALAFLTGTVVTSFAQEEKKEKKKKKKKEGDEKK
jgi:hypothetical protein